MEKQFIIYGDQGTGVRYRVRLNPDAVPGDRAAESGVILEYSEGDKWEEHFFIAPEAVEDIAKALKEFCE